jgi:hypothetical protein
VSVRAVRYIEKLGYLQISTSKYTRYIIKGYSEYFVFLLGCDCGTNTDGTKKA